MTKGNKYNLAAALTLFLSGIVLYILLRYEEAENVFYASCGIVYFAQYLLLSAGGFALALTCLGTWHTMNSSLGAGTILRFTFISLPLLILSSLIAYASLFFFCLI